MPIQPMNDNRPVWDLNDLRPIERDDPANSWPTVIVTGVVLGFMWVALLWKTDEIVEAIVTAIIAILRMS